MASISSSQTGELNKRLCE